MLESFEELKINTCNACEEYYCQCDNSDDEKFFDKQDIARASFGDMVNDYERNQLFYKAIRKSVSYLKNIKEVDQVNVIDIGCGTGLLSMMAAKSGADHVIACDVFGPIVKCAKSIVKRNKLSKKIDLIHKRSNELEITSKLKPNLLVAELLDTELIGEGCLFDYQHAIKNLVAKDALFVPSRARIYIQLVQSEQLFDCHQYRKSITLEPGVHIKTPKSALNCFGSHLLYDTQLNQLKPGKDFDILSDPLVVFKFDFTQMHDESKFNGRKRLKIPLIRKFDKPILIFSWWDLDMDFEGEIQLSCGPYWARGFESADKVAWRDHWMQTIYYLPAFAFTDTNLNGFNYSDINKKQFIFIDAFHDSFSFWYDLPMQNNLHSLEIENDTWCCICRLHSELSRNRLFTINSNNRLTTYWNAFKPIIEQCEHRLNLLYIGDESFLPLLFATHTNVQTVTIICQSKSSNFFTKYIEANKSIEDKVLVDLNQKILFQSFDLVISELYFRNFSHLFPSLEYFSIIEKMKHSLKDDYQSIPQKLVVKCLLVEFEHLWKSYGSVGDNSFVEGFDLTDYNELILKARDCVDWCIEPQQLWEYSSISLLHQPIDLFELKLANKNCSQPFLLLTDIVMNLKHLKNKFDSFKNGSDSKWPEKVALVVWIDQVLDQESRFIINNGAQMPVIFENQVVWCRGVQQGVGFLGSNWINELSEFNLQLSFKMDLHHRTFTYKII